MNTSPDLTHWQCLIERYFDAQTTEGEEAQLRAFVTSARADAEEFTSLRAELDEVRAVMGFTAVGRKLRRKSHRSIRWWQAAAAAVVVLMLGGVYTIQQAHPDDVCIAYVNGRKVTNPDEVVKLMQQEMQAVNSPTDAPTPESQLKDMFNTLNQ